MARIRSIGTKPEMRIRKILSTSGYRYRLHVKKLPGKPDIVMGKRKLVIYVNGCFWHQHPGCKRQSLPKTNEEYWSTKLRRNVEKQWMDIEELKRLGWNVAIIWECETKKLDSLKTRLKEILSE